MGFARELFPDEDLNEEFICTICQDVLQDPLVIEDCEHIYCSDCIKDWCGKCGSSLTCPMDRKPIQLNQLRAPQRSFLNLVNGLKRKCSFAEFGCTAVIALGDMRVHEISCRANPEFKTECKEGCGAMVTTVDEAHSCIVSLKAQLAALRVEVEQMKMEADNTKDRLRVLERALMDKSFDIEMQNWITQMCYDVLRRIPVASRQGGMSRGRGTGLNHSVEPVWNPFASLPPRPGPHTQAQAMSILQGSWQEQVYLVKCQDTIQQHLLDKYGGNWYCQVKLSNSEFRKATVSADAKSLEFCILNYEIVIRRV